MTSNPAGNETVGEHSDVSREIRFHHLFDSTADSAYLIETSSRRVLACNEAAEKRTGYSKDELIGQDNQEPCGKTTGYEITKAAVVPLATSHPAY